MESTLSYGVRELEKADVGLIADYWLHADEHHLKGMGVDPKKMFSRDDFTAMMLRQLALPLRQKRSFCLIWEINGKPAGHCNTNPTNFGVDAYMHLHLWEPQYRTRGLGHILVQQSLKQFFTQLQLKQIYSEPYALNPSPNKTLQKVGFELETEYTTVPGSLNFEQPVKRWIMTRERYLDLYS